MSPNMRLVDRADGNKGRFCIARDSVLHGAPYCEYYQEEGGWSSAGTVYVGEEWATERMKKIKEFEEGLCFQKESAVMKTVKVRIAVAISPDGSWNSCGWSDGTEKECMAIACDTVPEGESRFWLEAELPVNDVKVVRASISAV